MTEIIRGRVASIFDEQLIAVNKGSNDGVKVSDRVFILKEADIPDPDNPTESLGTAFVRRGTMLVEEVHEKFSIARVAKASKSMLSPAEPTFVVSRTRVGDGTQKLVFVEVGAPVDILLRDEDSLYRL